MKPLYLFVHPAYADVVCLPMTHFQWDALKRCGVDVRYGDELDGVQPTADDVLLCFGRIDERKAAVDRFNPGRRWHWVCDESYSAGGIYEGAMKYMEKGIHREFERPDDRAPVRMLPRRRLRFTADNATDLGELSAVLDLFIVFVGALRSAFRSRTSLVVENLALRQQLAILSRQAKRPRLVPLDRAFWIMLCRVWSRWTETLTIVKPETVVGWHRRGFARFWTWRSKRIGRPPIKPEIVELIVRMANDNTRWSRRRIAQELAKLGFRVDKNTVARYMPRSGSRPRPRPQTWGTFIRNHLAGTLAIDFFTVPTVTFDLLYVFVVLSLERRCLLHVSVTAHPYAEWAAQQMVEAFGENGAFKLLIRDRDGIFGAAFDRRVNNLGLRQLRIAPRAPWENGYAERLVGTFRRELTDHLIVRSERHLLRCVREYAKFYNEDRPHMSLAGDAPNGRDLEPPEHGKVVALPRLGGLHHRYTRSAA